LNTRRSAQLTAAIFVSIAIPVSTIRPLWLDELLQLIATRQTSIVRLLVDVRQTPGAAPLGYLVQQIALRITGYSPTFARLPSALFGAAAVFIVALIARQCSLKYPWLAAAIFAAFPQTLRYATESRTYAQALFFSSVATCLYLRLARSPTPAAALRYWLVLALAVYTQPYSIVVGLPHLIHSFLGGARKPALLCGSAVALSSLAFLPWFCWAHAAWQASNAISGFQFSFSIKTPLMLFREFAGAGYFGSALLLLLCAAALPGRCIDKPKRMLLILLIASAPVMVLCADAAFGYFVAARQIIWVLPAVAILTASVIECHPRAGLGLTALLVLICIRQSIVFYRSPGENWELAAKVLAEEIREGNCLVVAPAEQAPLYEFFQPELRTRPCRSGGIVLAITPAATDAQERNALASLVAAGHKVASVRTVGRSRIVLFR
jgi:uncharacterized membrane protein